MTQEQAKSKIRMSVVVNKDHIKSLEKSDELIDQIFNDHEAQLKAKNEEIKELGEIVQQYLIPSKNYDAIIKAKDDEIRRLNNLYADTIKDLGDALIEIERLKSYIEKLWQIVDDIDTYGDMAKSNNAMFRSLVENKQKERWELPITTDGYKLIYKDTK